MKKESACGSSQAARLANIKGTGEVPGSAVEGPPSVRHSNAQMNIGQDLVLLI